MNNDRRDLRLHIESALTGWYLKMIKTLKQRFKAKDRYQRPILHFLFWMIMYQFFIYIKKPLLGLSYWMTALVELRDLFVISSIFYFVSYYLIPQALKNKRYFILFISVFLIYYFYAFTAYIEFLTLPELMEVPGRGYKAFSNRILSAGITGILLLDNLAEILLDLSYLLSPALIVKLCISLVNSRAQTLRLERDNLNLELAFLKSQINPHFLFNTLNNVYSLALHKSDKTADVILKLSDLMRYTLYDSNTSYISIGKELQFCKNYIELERIRHSERVEIKFKINANEEVPLTIAPLLIFPFIENAFKHGINVSVDHSWVDINILVRDSTLFLSITNSKFSYKHPLAFGGIGIANTNKRLSLLYPKKFKLDVKDEEKTYSVNLILDLR